MEEEGKWITINGTHVFIKKGQSPIDALIRQKAKKQNRSKSDAIPFNDKASETKKYLDSDEASKYFFKDGKFGESKNNEWKELKSKVFEENKMLSDKIKQNVQQNLDRPSVFNSKEEIKKWGKDIGINIEDNFIDNIDIRAMNDIKPTLEKIFKQYPELKNNFTLNIMEGTNLHDGLAEANVGLTLNKREFEDYGKALKQATEQRMNGQLVNGNGTIQTLYAHELGHNYKSKLIDKKFFDYEKEHFGSREWSTKEYDDVKSNFRKKMKQDLRELQKLDGVSKYSFTNDEETFAEGFAEYTMGDSEFGKAFGKKLNEWNKEINEITSKKYGEMSTYQLMQKYIAKGYSKETAIEMALKEKGGINEVR